MPTTGQIGSITPAIWGVPNALERGTKAEVAHNWADWLHYPCCLKTTPHNKAPRIRNGQQPTHRTAQETAPQTTDHKLQLLTPQPLAPQHHIPQPNIPQPNTPTTPHSTIQHASPTSHGPTHHSSPTRKPHALQPRVCTAPHTIAQHTTATQHNPTHQRTRERTHMQKQPIDEDIV